MSLCIINAMSLELRAFRVTTNDRSNNVEQTTKVKTLIFFHGKFFSSKVLFFFDYSHRFLKIFILTF